MPRLLVSLPEPPFPHTQDPSGEAAGSMNHSIVAPRDNEPCYNEDPVITNNIWKPGKITVKYVETNPAITNISFVYQEPRRGKYCAVGFKTKQFFHCF